MSNIEPFQNEISIDSVSIISEDGDVLINIPAENPTGQISLDYITFIESLDSPLIEGYLIFNGIAGEFEKLQLVGNETLIISATTPSNDDGNDNSSFLFPEFSIHSFEDSSNFTDLSKTPEGYSQRKITIKFCTKEGKELFERTDIVPYGFVGRISSGELFKYESGEQGPNGEPGEVGIVDSRGLIEVLSGNFSAPIDSEPTLNYVWLKPKQVSMPTRKKLEKMNFLQTIEYCKNYAISENNQYAVNYYFWNDLSGWHFKSIDYMIRNQKKEIPVFSISSNVIDSRRIYSFDVHSDFSEYSAIANKSIYSYYYRLFPDYYSPYSRFMDDREKYITEKIIYNYRRMYPQIAHVESSDIYKEKTVQEIDSLENPSLLFNDSMYGWLNQRGFNDSDSVNSILLLGDELITQGGTEDPGDPQPPGEEGRALLLDGDDERSGEIYVPFDLAHFDAYETNKWQEMHDITNLNGEILKKIVTEIKQPVFTAKKRYRDALAYKEKWNIYKYSVCCSVDETESTDEQSSIMVVIKESDTIGRNIYRYSWSEVVFIPKIELGNFMGATMGNLPVDNYGINVEQLNSIPISVPYPGQYTFTKFGQPYFPEVIGDLSGEIFVAGPTGQTLEDGGFTGCGITFSYTNAVTRAISEYFKDCQNPGMTLTFYNDKYSPFLVMERPNGAKGSYEDSSGAYNLNEVLNRVVYEETSYPKLEGSSLDSILYYQREGENIDMPNNIPGSSAEWDVLIGPGINANKEYTDYPKGFASMPVGSYQRVSNPDSGLSCFSVPFGYITKLSSVKTNNLPKYGIDLRNYGESENLGSKTIYYFSATNAQDGKCSDLVGTCNIGVP